MTSIIDLLRQDEIWRGQDGRLYVVDDMDHDYHVNLLTYLRRNAARLREHAIWHDACDNVDDVEAAVRSLESRSSRDWIDDQRLTRRLEELVNRHGSIEPDILTLGEGTGTITSTRVTDGVSFGSIERTSRDAR